MNQISDYNYIYGLFERHSYIINPTTLAFAGGMTFGIPGAITGLIAGVVDEALTYTEVTKENHLSGAFIGFGLGYTIYPSYITASFGLACGTIISTDFTKKYLHNYDIFYPIISIITGASKGGVKGAMIGGLIGITDQVLIGTSITDNHYFTYSLMSVTSINAAFGSSFIIDACGGALGAIIAHYEKKIYLGEKLYSTYAKILEPQQLANHLSAHIETTLILQILHQQSMMRVLKYEQNLIYQFEHLDDRNTAPLSKLYSNSFKFLLFIAPFSGYELVSQLVKSYYSTKLYLQIDDNLRDLLFTNETALRLSYDKDATTLIDNLRTDSRIIAYDGAKILTDAVSKVTNGLYGYGTLINNSPDLLIYSVVYNQVTQFVSTFLSTKQTLLHAQIKQQESAISTELKHSMHNIKVINERGGLDFAKSKLANLYDQLRVYELEKDQVSLAFEVWMYFTSVTDFIYNYYLVGSKISIGKINFENRKSVHYGSWQVSKLLAWSGKKAQEIEKINRSIESIDLFLNKTKYYRHDSNDQIIRLKHVNKFFENQLILSDLTITVKDQAFVRVDHLELDYGHRYAFIGPSGAGKSILVSKIIGIQENQIGGTGIIHFIENTKIILVSQQDYFPLNVTLIEAVFYPNPVNEQQVELVRSLLNETGIIQYNLNQTENWASVLSGGQKKKIIIISSIIKQPDILILDESFNGLDQNSIQLLQNLIIKYLHASLIISIDHNLSENNQTGFYTDNLELINGSLFINPDQNYKSDICPYETQSHFYSGIFENDLCCAETWPCY